MPPVNTDINFKDLPAKRVSSGIWGLYWVTIIAVGICLLVSLTHSNQNHIQSASQPKIPSPIVQYIDFPEGTTQREFTAQPGVWVQVKIPPMKTWRVSPTVEIDQWFSNGRKIKDGPDKNIQIPEENGNDLFWIRAIEKPGKVVAAIQDRQNITTTASESSRVATISRVRNIAGVAYSYPKNTWAIKNPIFGSMDESSVNLSFVSGLIYGTGSIEWHSSFDLKPDQLCVKITNLKLNKDAILSEFYSDIAVGYAVRLENAVFGDYTVSRVLTLFKTFEGDSPPSLIEKTFEIKTVSPSSECAYVISGEWEGSYNDKSSNGDIYPTEFTARFRQKGNNFDGVILESIPSKNGQTRRRSSISGLLVDNRITFVKRRSSISGLLVDNRITFVKTYEGDPFGISYVSSPTQAPGSLTGTWYAGFSEGSWKMVRKGDYEGSPDDILNPNLSNPPEEK